MMIIKLLAQHAFITYSDSAKLLQPAYNAMLFGWIALNKVSPTHTKKLSATI